MKNFRDLQVWQKAHSLTLAVYEHTVAFPDHERYGLTSQLRRAAASVPANLAEGCGRGSDADLRRFLQMAMGSASETEYHVLLAHDLGFLAAPTYQRLTVDTQEVKRMLAAFIQKINADVNPRSAPGADR
jgi:four helix bundle protein